MCWEDSTRKMCVRDIKMCEDGYFLHKWNSPNVIKGLKYILESLNKASFKAAFIKEKEILNKVLHLCG